MSVGVFGCCCPPNPPCEFSIYFDTVVANWLAGDPGDYVTVCGGSMIPSSVLTDNTMVTNVLNAQLFCDLDQITDGVTWAIAVYCKKRDVYTAWDMGTTYAIGDRVTFGSHNYQSITSGNVGKDPSFYTSDWLQLDGPCDEGIASALPGNGSAFFDGGICDYADEDDLPVVVDDNTNPLTTFSLDLTGFYNYGAAGGDFNVVISITATYLGVDYTTYGIINFHAES